MPRGYLKRSSREVGNKAARGGSSKKNRKRGDKSNKISSARYQHDTWEPPTTVVLRNKNRHKIVKFDEDIEFSTTLRALQHNVEEPTPDAEENVGEASKEHDQTIKAAQEECVVCCDTTTTLVRLFDRCSRHPLACRSCVRRIYITDAQKDVQNYPLRCFYPECEAAITHTQVQNLVENKRELQRHHRLTAQAKSMRKPGSTTLNCPRCDHPHAVQRVPSSAIATHSRNWSKHQMEGRIIRRFGCASCGFVFERSTPVAPAGAILPDRIGGTGNGWALCPRCNMVISKGDGCDHMSCPCGQQFSWERAKNAARSQRGVAKDLRKIGVLLPAPRPQIQGTR